MSLIGTVDHFVPGSSFSKYMERMGILFALNNIPEGTKKNLFITLSGPAIFDEIKLIYPEAKIEEIDYNQMIAKLKERLDKTQPNMMNRHKFSARVQGLDEPAENFVLALKLLASQCGFGAHKNEAIKDRIVFGLRDSELKHKLLMKDNMTLEEVEEIVVRTELAKLRAKEAEQNEGHRSVNSVKYRLGQRENKYGDGRPSSSGYTKRYRSRSNDSGPSSGGYSKRYRSRSRSTSRERGNVRFNARFGDNNRHYNRNFYQDRPKANYYERREYEPVNLHANVICNYCKKRGHVKRNCYQLQNRKAVNFMNEEEIETYDFKRLRIQDSDDEDEDYPCMMISTQKHFSEPCLVDALVEGTLLSMEIDCGAAVSVISLKTYEKYFKHMHASHCNSRLVVVNGQQLNIFGQIRVNVSINNMQSQVSLIILESMRTFVPLLGRNWLDIFYPQWRKTFGKTMSVNVVQNGMQQADSEGKFQYKIRLQFPKIFDGDFSNPITGFEADLVLKEDMPVFRKAYEVPYKIREKVIEHLDSLEKQNVITPIKVSEWASPIVIVLKKDNDIRMVIDCRVSINKLIIPDTYPLPLAQDIFATLSGCKWFCCLDLAGAYTQLQLSKRSRKFVVINTIKGLYTYNRLPQGATSSASIFQKIMDQILIGLKHVSCYLDDVLIAGETKEECQRNLYLVLDRLEKANIKVNLKKCKFFVQSLTYLGHLITENGLLPSSEKLATIKEAKVPTDVSGLKAFLGLINFYGKFVPHLSAKLSCLYALLRKDTKFIWTDLCQKTFEESKLDLINANILEFYNPKKHIIVVSDACSYGLGGVIAHKIGEQEKPISFVSFSLNAAQKTYPILHLEALAVVCTVKKFHKYLFGQRFTIYTDHKPLLGIFGKEGRNQICVTRLQRYVMEMSIYDYEICYRPSSQMGNADFCSRFPLPETVPKKIDNGSIKSINFFGEFPLDYAQIANETKTDFFLSKVARYIEEGWPNKMVKIWQPVFSLRYDLEVTQGCVLYQDRVFIPESLRSPILKLLHSNHNGVVKMKQMARRCLFWFSMNEHIENYVKQCQPCMKTATYPKIVSNTSWTPTTRPFSRIHADFFFFESKTFLLVVDSNTKWLEIELMKYGTDTNKVIKKFTAIFGRFGLPDVLVTDGGPPFNSAEFCAFMERQGIRVMKSPPYNPSSNGQAERMVRVVKDVFKKFILDPETRSLDIEDRITLFLANYRNTCSSDNRFPSEKILSFKPKILVDLLHPKRTYKDFLEPLKKQASFVDTSTPSQDPFTKLVLGDKILYKNNTKHALEKWIEASYVKRVSPNVFTISIGSHTTNAHRHQLRLVDPRPTATTIRIPIQRNKRLRDETSSDDEDFLGFPDVPVVPEANDCRRFKQVKRSPIITRSRSRSKQNHNEAEKEEIMCQQQQC